MALAEVGTSFGGTHNLMGRRPRSGLHLGSDLEIPRWIETLECLEHSPIPFRRLRRWNLGVADVHRHIIYPSRHLARDVRSLDRDVRAHCFVQPILSKVSYRRIQYGLKIFAKLIVALRKCRNWEKTEQQDRNKLDYFPFQDEHCPGTTRSLG